MSAKQAIQDLEALGVALRFNAYKVDLTAPDKTTYVMAIQRVQAAMREGEYQSMVDLIRTRDAFSWNIPSDTDGGPDLEHFKAVAHLRAVCMVEGFAIAKIDQGFMLLAEPPYSSDMLEAMDYAYSILEPLEADLVPYAEKFPELDQARATRHITQLIKHHQQDGFEVRGWHGCRFPETWPGYLMEAVQTIYVLSLYEPVGAPEDKRGTRSKERAERPLEAKLRGVQ